MCVGSYFFPSQSESGYYTSIQETVGDIALSIVTLLLQGCSSRGQKGDTLSSEILNPL